LSAMAASCKSVCDIIQVEAAHFCVTSSHLTVLVSSRLSDLA